MSDQHFDVAILQPGYLPWLGYFDLVCSADAFVIYDDVQFDRGGWRNRNRVLCGGNAFWLSVPIIRVFPQLIRDVRIAPEKWQVKHLRTINQNYKNAPYFDLVFPPLDAYLSAKRYEWLLDLCLEGHSLLTQLIGIPAKVYLASELGIEKIGRTERLVAICRQFHGTRYISPDAAAGYMDSQLWEEAGIELVYQQYPHPRYSQFADEFVSHLSVIDALMFAGPEMVRSWIGGAHPRERTVASVISKHSR